MKRLTPRYKRWLVRRAQAGTRKRAWKVAILSRGDSFSLVRVSGKAALPSVLCLDRNYDDTIAFFHDLRIRTIGRISGSLRIPTGRRAGRIGWVRHFRDFTPLRAISAGAALMLAAEYDRIGRLSGIPPATIDLHKWDHSVKATLAGLGFFELLGIRPDVDAETTTQVIQPMVSGDSADMTGVNQTILDLFNKVGGDTGLRVQLASAVTDAVENVRNHAYPLDWFSSSRSVPLWWFTGAADHVNGRVTLAIYDQGVTIPSSLPRRWDLKFLETLFTARFRLPFAPEDPTYDAEAIDMAMQLGVTSTNVRNRGRGLPKILEIIQNCPEGRLRIVSRCGECLYHSSGSRAVSRHHIPLMGTYIELEAQFSELSRRLA